MHRLQVFLSVSLLILVVTPALGQAQISDPGARRICAEVRDVELPARDRPGPEEAEALAQCDSEGLYFGFGQPADPVQARKCAYVEMERGGKEPVFGGRTMLMTVYANGKGAARNFDVALKLACETGGAPQDISGRVHQLARLKRARWTGDNFSVCDHSGGKYLYEQCAILQDRLDSREREKRLNAITRTWSAKEKQALQALREAAGLFFKARAGKEANLAATLEVQELAFLEERLVATLEGFERGDLPRQAFADDLREADAAMDAAYSNTQNANVHNWGTVTPGGIKETQQAWLPYRDAWVALGRTRYPSVSAESWRTWVTRQRTGMLKWFRDRSTTHRGPSR